jgi:hypothetical protein
MTTIRILLETKNNKGKISIVFILDKVFNQTSSARVFDNLQ